MGHPQPATPMQVDNSTCYGTTDIKIYQKSSKEKDIKFYWVQDRHLVWEKLEIILLNQTRHHLTREYNKYVYTVRTLDRILRGCVILGKPPIDHKAKIYPQDDILLQKKN